MKLLLYAAILAAGFVLASFASFWLAVHPPRLSIPGTPADYRLAAEDVVIRTDDGLRLAGWLVPRPGAPGVILLHGYPAEKSDLLPIAAALARRFTVLLVDQRYFGRSEGRVTTLGFHERRDLQRAVDFLVARGVASVGVFGFSLGGAVGFLAAAEDPRIRAVVAYAPFTDLKVLGRELYAWMWLLKYPFVELMLLWARIFLGTDITVPSPAAAAARLAIPVLVIHSRQDEQIPFAHAERFQHVLAGNPRAEFELMPSGRHGVLPPDFEARLAAFYGRHLR